MNGWAIVNILFLVYAAYRLLELGVKRRVRRIAPHADVEGYLSGRISFAELQGQIEAGE